MARLEGFEPPTNGFGSHYSIRLSYRRIVCGMGWREQRPGPMQAQIVAEKHRAVIP